MIDRDAFDDRLQEHRLSGAGRSDDERALAVSDWRDQIDCAARQLGSALGGTSRLELELALGIRSDERAEIRTPCCLLRVGPVDLLDVDDDDAIAMIVSGSGEELITAAEHVLPHDLGRHVGIARLGQIAVRGASDEATFALRIEPPGGLPIGNDRSDWCAGQLLGAATTASATTTTTASPRSALLALPASPALIAGAAPVVSVALARMPLLVSVAWLTAAAFVGGLRIVLRLRSATGIARSVRWSGGSGIRFRIGRG